MFQLQVNAEEKEKKSEKREEGERGREEQRHPTVESN
jgi:hypothetical protein